MERACWAAEGEEELEVGAGGVGEEVGGGAAEEGFGEEEEGDEEDEGVGEGCEVVVPLPACCLA